MQERFEKRFGLHSAECRFGLSLDQRNLLPRYCKQEVPHRVDRDAELAGQLHLSDLACRVALARAVDQLRVELGGVFIAGSEDHRSQLGLGRKQTTNCPSRSMACWMSQSQVRQSTHHLRPASSSILHLLNCP